MTNQPISLPEIIVKGAFQVTIYEVSRATTGPGVQWQCLTCGEFLNGFGYHAAKDLGMGLVCHVCETDDDEPTEAPEQPIESTIDTDEEPNNNL